MSEDKNKKNQDNKSEETENIPENNAQTEETEVNTEAECETEVETESEEENKLAEELKKANDSYIRLMADFDNYKKKSLKEKSDLIKFGGESIIKNLLPIMDDFERALKNMPEEDDNAVKEGVVLIYGKFVSFLNQSGVKEIATIGEPFDTDFHEAITMIQAQDDAQKGKITDCVQKGYTYHDKVIRYAKVVVAQ